MLSIFSLIWRLHTGKVCRPGFRQCAEDCCQKQSNLSERMVKKLKVHHQLLAASRSPANSWSLIKMKKFSFLRRRCSSRKIYVFFWLMKMVAQLHLSTAEEEMNINSRMNNSWTTQDFAWFLAGQNNIPQ